VVADQRTTLDEEAPPAIFLPFDQDSTTTPPSFLRTAGDPLALAPAARAENRPLRPETAISTS